MKYFQSIIWPSLIFIAALLPRLYGLGSFLTIDEVKWAEGAAQFLLGLSSGDLFQTYWHFHPGTTITWGSALALWGVCATSGDLAACVQTQVEHLNQSIGWLRLSPVLWTSLGVALVYHPLRTLFNQRVALIVALFLAFDPFFIAHSRILNGDAGAAILMFLALLTFLTYWVKVKETVVQAQPLPGSFYLQSSLILSGIFAGLALSTKLPSPLLGLFVGLLGVGLALSNWPQGGVRVLQRWLVILLIWGITALLAFFLLWPAMWVAPLKTLRLMYVDAFAIGGAGAGHSTYFLGQVSNDPGLLFYPYVIAFRLTPVIMIGVIVAIVWLLIQGRQLRSTAPEPTTEKHSLKLGFIMTAFIIFVILLSAVSPKKLDRYVMSTIPAFILLATLGFTFLLDFLHQHWGQTSTNFISTIFGLLLLFQLGFALSTFPYNLTYYNPLLGGQTQAIKQIPVGWGEGLEQAAHYLNALPEAEHLTVSSWYGDIFHPYFVGQSNSFSDDGRGQLSANYVVFYVNQIQRQKPYPGLVDYFRNNPEKLVATVDSAGNLVDYTTLANAPTSTAPYWVEIYKAPAAQSASGAPKIEGVAQLLAYKIGEGLALRAGEQIPITLFLRTLGDLPAGTTFRVGLTEADPAAGEPEPWGQWSATKHKDSWQPDHIVEWQGVLALPAEMPAGGYRLWSGLQFEDGSLIAAFLISDKDPTYQVE